MKIMRYDQNNWKSSLYFFLADSHLTVGFIFCILMKYLRMMNVVLLSLWKKNKHMWPLVVLCRYFAHGICFRLLPLCTFLRQGSQRRKSSLSALRKAQLHVVNPDGAQFYMRLLTGNRL
jgi:hypothetical protein